MEAAASHESIGAIERSRRPSEHVADRSVRPTLVRHPLATGLIAGLAAVVAFAAYSSVGDRVIAGTIAAVLVLIAATDLEQRIIPNPVVLPATVLVLVARIAVAPGHTVEWLLASLGTGLFFLLPNLINSSAIGMGDVKLGLFLGAGLGVGALAALMVAFVSMFPFALGMLVRGGLAARKTALPFAPFLAFGGLVILIVPRLVGLGGS